MHTSITLISFVKTLKAKMKKCDSLYDSVISIKDRSDIFTCSQCISVSSDNIYLNLTGTVDFKVQGNALFNGSYYDSTCNMTLHERI